MSVILVMALVSFGGPPKRPSEHAFGLRRGWNTVNAMRRATWRVFSRVGSLVSIAAALCVATTAARAQTPAAPADDATRPVAVAAAANFVFALDALQAAFAVEHPQRTLTLTTGASGNLVAQIRHGAPYDVFLSADLDYPRALIEAGTADASSLTTFAVGRLVLWTLDPALSLDPLANALRDPRIRKLAIANTDSAPYGRRAREVLEALGLWTEVQSKLVIGENITQTAQFVETRNADAGFVALSLTLSPKLKERGHWVLVPENLYAPLDHGAVLTRRGAANPGAREFLQFLRSPAARKVLQNFGYGMPR